MKKLFTSIFVFLILLIVIIVIIYLLTSFIKAELNPYMWKESDIVIMSGIIATLSPLLVLITISLKRSVK